MVASLPKRRGSPLLFAFRKAPRKRKSIGQVNPNCKWMKLLRAAETPQQRQARSEQNRTRNAESRAAETPQQCEARLEQKRTGTAESRVAETTEQRESRLEKVRTTAAESRETETAQHRSERLAENRMRIAETRQAVMRWNFNLEAGKIRR
jgi:hypothetical protein